MDRRDACTAVRTDRLDESGHLAREHDATEVSELTRERSADRLRETGLARRRSVARFVSPFSAKNFESHDNQRVSTVAALGVVDALTCRIAHWFGSVPMMIGSERSRSSSMSSSAPATETHGESHDQASGRHS